MLHTLNEYIYELTQGSRSFDSPLVEISPDGKTLVSVDDWTGNADKHTFKIWDLQTGKLLYVLPELLEAHPITISNNGLLIACANDNYTIKVWDLNSGKLLHTLIEHSDSIIAFAVSPDSQTLVSSSADRTINIWNLNTGSLIQTLSGHLSSVSSVSFSQNGQIMVVKTRKILSKFGNYVR